MFHEKNTFKARLGEFRVHTLHHTRWNRRLVTGVSVRGTTYDVSPEFWHSLLLCFHISPSAVEFMDYLALFRLLQETSPQRLLQCEVEWEGCGGGRITRVLDPNLVRIPCGEHLSDQRATLAVVN